MPQTQSTRQMRYTTSVFQPAPAPAADLMPLVDAMALRAAKLPGAFGMSRNPLTGDVFNGSQKSLLQAYSMEGAALPLMDNAFAQVALPQQSYKTDKRVFRQFDAMSSLLKSLLA